MASWTNWADTVHADVTVSGPATVRELADVVTTAAARGQRVKPIGAGHSFTAIGATDGVQLRLDRLSGIVAADRDANTVTVLAGTPLHALNASLWRLGLSLSNLGDIDVQTIAGAISTGTHGTGAKLGGLATQVRALDLVLADGSLRTCSAEHDPELFAAARVGLGALGVIASLTLQCEPAFALAAAEAPASLDGVLADLDELVSGNDHFEFYWFPHTRRVLTKRNNRVLPDTELRPLRPVRRWVDDEFLSNTVFDQVNRMTTARPGLIPRANAIASRLLTARDYIDRSYVVFASPRRVRFREMEYAVPRDALPDVLAEIEKYLSRSGDLIGFPVEVRFAAADDIWLSTAHGRDTGYVAVHQYHRRDHEPYFRAVEDDRPARRRPPALGQDALSGRRVAARDLPAPRRLRRAPRSRLDPDRMFGNAYLRQVLGS